MQNVTVNFIQKQKLVEDYKNGMTARELSEKYGCAITSVYRYLRESNVIRQQRRPFDGDTADKMRKEYESGDTTTIIAQRYGRSASVVAAWIREAGGTIRVRNGNA